MDLLLFYFISYLSQKSLNEIILHDQHKHKIISLTILLGQTKVPAIGNDHKHLKIGILLAFATASLFCNSLIVHVVRVNSHMHTTINYFIVNMAFCDIIGTFIATGGTMLILKSGRAWKGGAFNDKPIYCKGTHYLMYTICLCSIFSVVIITFDRFLAVTRPLKYHNRIFWNRFIMPGIWLASMAIPANYCVNNVTLCITNNSTFCIPRMSSVDAILMFGFGFALPHVVMVILYLVIAYKLWTRQVPGEHAHAQEASQNVAKKVTIMIFCILVAFEVAWAPVFVDEVFLYIFSQPRKFDEIKFIVHPILVISNGIFNTMIYTIFNENFRNAIQEALKWQAIKRQYETCISN